MGIGTTCEHDPFQCSYVCETGDVPGAPHIKLKVEDGQLDAMVKRFVEADKDARQEMWKKEVLDLPEEQQHDFIERHRVSVKDHERAEVDAWDKQHQADIQAKLGKDGLEHAGHQEEGCLITGFLEVRRVPGTVVIEAFSPWHEFAAHKLDMDHDVGHFSFGEVGATAMVMDSLGHAAKLPDGLSTLGGKSYHTETEHHTHEHYMKVVETEVVHHNTKHLVTFDDQHIYRYTVANHMYLEESQMPKLKFTYELDPMGVLVQDIGMPFYKFITTVCAIIGGAFTMFGLLDGAFYHGMRSIEKKMALNKAN